MGNEKPTIVGELLDTVGKVEAKVEAALDAADKSAPKKANRKEQLVQDATAVLGLSRLYAVNSNGVVSNEFIPFDVEDILLSLPRQPAHDDKPIRLRLGEKNDLTLDAGAGVVLGKADSGKSLFANTVKRLNSDEVVILRFREPESDSILSERELVATLYSALVDPTIRVIMIDSLRTIFYSASGTTGKGGVNMGIFERVTAFDVLMRQLGKLVLFALNPMSSDADAIEFYLEAARGSVSHTFHATNPRELKLSSRSNRDRGWKSHTYDPKAAAAAGFDGPLVKESPNSFAISPQNSSSSILDLYGNVR